jgi:hypothetical protein
MKGAWGRTDFLYALHTSNLRNIKTGSKHKIMFSAGLFKLPVFYRNFIEI